MAPRVYSKNSNEWPPAKNDRLAVAGGLRRYPDFPDSVRYNDRLILATQLVIRTKYLISVCSIRSRLVTREAGQYLVLEDLLMWPALRLTFNAKSGLFRSWKICSFKWFYRHLLHRKDHKSGYQSNYRIPLPAPPGSLEHWLASTSSRRPVSSYSW